MNKIKAKLAALFMAVCCCLGCLGVGVVFLQQRKANITAKAATAEELTAEFTNNGQFVLEQDTQTSHMPTILEGSEVTATTLPSGYEGAVLQAHRSSSSDGWDMIRFNFTASQIKAEDVISIVVRAWVENFNSANDEVRVKGANGTTRQYGIGTFDLSTWCDIPLTVNSIADMTDENGYLSATEFAIRDKTEASHLYIDSVTVNLATEFTDNSMFTVSPYSDSMAISYHFDESLPSGSEGAVMRIKTVSGQAYVNLDFSKAQLKASTVESISVRAYSPDYTGEDEFRFNNASVAGNIGKYDMSTWCDIPVDISKIQTDENGYLTTITVGLRDKGTLSTYFYIDSITVKKVAYTTYEMGALSVRDNVSTNKRIYANTANYKIAELPFQSWTDLFEFESGSGLKINGETAAMGTMYSSDNGITFTFPEVTEVGTVLSIGGTFRCPTRQTKYVIEDSAFTWNGQTWEKFVTNDHLEAYDVITIQDIDLGSEVTWEGTVNEVQHQFAPSVENTTNSLVFRFGYNCTDTALEGASLRFRLRGSNWTGICFDLKDGKIYLVDAGLSYALASNTDYVIEIGTISMKDGKIWTYIKLNEAMVLSEVITTSQLVDFSDFATTGFTNHVSIYASGIAKTTITDPDGIAVTYVSTAGTHVEKVRKDQLYTLVMGKSEKVFIAWEYNGELYAPGQEFGVVETAITFTAVELDFTMEAGASIRLSPTAEYSGIRFTSRINEAEWQAFVEEYAPESFSYGTLIMPYDYLGYGQKPNLEDFVAGEEVLKIETKEGQSADGYLVMRGAMQKIYEGNYGRLFAGRAYVEITLANGMVLTAYTAFDNEDNVRSIRQVAKEFKADTSEPQSANEFRYHTITDEQRAIVDAYIGAEEILLMNYGVYAANATSIIAWNFPALDAANNYMNDANIAVANTMKEAGIQVIGLTGANLVKMDTAAKIEKTRQIINFFWSQGIGTFAFQSNGGNSLNNSFAQTGYPDFSDCEGFMGFLVWDEPGVDAMDTIATQVAAFEAAYAGTDAIFMGNLLPSYASIFKTNSGYDRAAFKAYLQKYCDVVLSQVSGTKWLSIDTYPIYADKTLVKNFLFDIGTLKTVALENDAHAHVILQAYGHVEGENALRSRIPSEAELRMQAYTAMAFGVDSMSWYTYSPNGHGENDTVVDVNGAITNQDNYNAFKNINAELTAIGKVYNAFAWKGIILGAGNDNGVKIDSWEITKDNDYKAFEMVMGQLGDYELSATDTKHLSSVQTNKTDWNYLMGVMEDAHGNEGYVLCNYNSHEADRAQTITLTFDSNVTEAVIYRGGVAQTVSVTDKTLTVDLATGEGVIILPSKLN